MSFRILLLLLLEILLAVVGSQKLRFSIEDQKNDLQFVDENITDLHFLSSKGHLIFLGTWDKVIAVPINDIIKWKYEMEFRSTSCTSSSCKNYVGVMIHLKPKSGIQRAILCGSKSTCSIFEKSSNTKWTQKNDFTDHWQYRVVWKASGKPFAPVVHYQEETGVMYYSTAGQFHGYLQKDGLEQMITSYLMISNIGVMKAFYEAGDYLYILYDDAKSLNVNVKSLRRNMGQVEHSGYVARVCKADIGSDKWHREFYFQSLFRSRLECSLTDPTSGQKIFFNQLISSTQLIGHSTNSKSPLGDNIFYALMMHKTPVITLLAVCGFSLSDVDEVLNKGSYLYQEDDARNRIQYQRAYFFGNFNAKDAWKCPVKPVKNSEDAYYRLLALQSRDAVKSIDSKVLAVMGDLPGTAVSDAFKKLHISNDVGITMEVLPGESSADGGHHDVFFVGTASGSVVKFSVSSPAKPPVYVETLELLKARVDKIVVHRDFGRFVAINTGQLVSAPLARCATFTDCSSCVGLRDPFCSWDMKTSTCTYQLGSSNPGIANITSGVHKLCPPSPKRKAPTSTSVLTKTVPVAESDPAYSPLGNGSETELTAGKSVAANANANDQNSNRVSVALFMGVLFPVLAITAAAAFFAGHMCTRRRQWILQQKQIPESPESPEKCTPADAMVMGGSVDALEPHKRSLLHSLTGMFTPGQSTAPGSLTGSIAGSRSQTAPNDYETAPRVPGRNGLNLGLQRSPTEESHRTTVEQLPPHVRSYIHNPRFSSSDTGLGTGTGTLQSSVGHRKSSCYSEDDPVFKDMHLDTVYMSPYSHQALPRNDNVNLSRLCMDSTSSAASSDSDLSSIRKYADGYDEDTEKLSYV